MRTLELRFSDMSDEQLQDARREAQSNLLNMTLTDTSFYMERLDNIEKELKNRGIQL